MRIWEKFCTLSRARQIVLVVFCLHFVAIFALSIHHLIQRQKTARTKIAVRTVRPPSVPRTISPPPRASTTLNAKSTQVEQQKAKRNKALPSRKTNKASPKISQTDETLLREIAANLEILNSKTSPPMRPSLILPMSPPQSIQVEEADVADPGYGEILAVFLQRALELPEYGEVKVRLEIDSGGQLTHLEILETQSRKNGDFLRKRLPELFFPSSSDPCSFTITFKNRA